MPGTLEDLQAAVNAGQISAEDAAKLARGESPVVKEPAKASPAPVVPAAEQPAPKLVPRTATDQGFSQGRNVVDVAELSGWGNLWNRKHLRERGFSYQDATTGNIVSVDPNSLSRRDFRLMARNAARQEKLARRFGIGDTTGWSQDAINLRKQQVGNDFRYTTLNPQAVQAAEAAPEAGRSWNYNLSNSGWEGDNAFYGTTAEGLLKALYENKQYDVLDALKGADGTITYDSMKAYQAGLGTGDEFTSGNYGKGSLDAMLAKQYITQEQYNRLVNGLGTPSSAAPAAATAATGAIDLTNFTDEQLADQVIAGRFGTADARRQALGSRYGAVQAIVNQRYGRGATSGSSSSTTSTSTAPASGAASSAGTEETILAVPKAQKGTSYTVTAGNYQYNDIGLPYMWAKAGLKPEDVQYTKTGNSWWHPRKGYYTLTPEQAKIINDYYTSTPSSKSGGKITRMKYFQQGGSVAAQQVAQEQAQQQEAQLTEMFMALAKNPKETLMALQKQGVQPKQVIELAQKMADKNPAAKEALAALSQMSQMAKQGAKLTYIKRLRGECPEGYEPKLYRAGGKVCTKCEKVQADKCGGKAKKHENGGEAELVTEFKNRKKK